VLSIGRRALALLIGYFALLGFMAVPIGDRTGLQHLRVFLSTPEASRAVESLGALCNAARNQLASWLVGHSSDILPSGSARGNGEAMHGQGSGTGKIIDVLGHHEHGRSVARDRRLEHAAVSPGQER